MSVSTNTLFTNNITLLVLGEYKAIQKMFSYLIGKEMVLMTDIFLAFSLLFIFIIVGFWIMSKIDRFINSLRDKLQKMMPWKMITQKVMIMKIGKTTSEA